MTSGCDSIQATATCAGVLPRSVTGRTRLLLIGMALMILTRIPGRSLASLQATPSTAPSWSWLPALCMAVTEMDVVISGSDAPGVYFRDGSMYICSLCDGSCHVELLDCVRGCSAASISHGILAPAVDTVRQWRGTRFPLQPTFYRSHGLGLHSACSAAVRCHVRPAGLPAARAAQVAVHLAPSQKPTTDSMLLVDPGGALACRAAWSGR